MMVVEPKHVGTF